jgi:small-conductance mechanosensitive channel
LLKFFLPKKQASSIQALASIAFALFPPCRAVLSLKGIGWVIFLASTTILSPVRASFSLILKVQGRFGHLLSLSSLPSRQKLSCILLRRLVFQFSIV